VRDANNLFKKVICNPILICLLLLIAGCEAESTKEEAKSVLQVEGYLVIAQPFKNELTTTAKIMANEQVELKAPMSGQVLGIYFKEGASVQKGELLVRLDDRNWKAEMIGVQAELDASEKMLERKKALLGIGGSSQEELDQAIARVETLKSQIQLLRVNIDIAEVTAPFSGRLGMRDFSTGAFLNQGDVITNLTEIRQLKVDFTISQNHERSIEVGNTVLVLIGDDTLKATIYAINPVIDAQTRTINARAIMQQPAGKKVMPGTFAEVQVTTDYLSDALLIPSQAIVQSITEQTVYISKNGKAVRKVVEVGNRTANKVHIISGIQAGDTVLTTGLLSVKDGMDLIFQSIN
jgi:membrane fusion protein (multidrug efflux system)